MRDTLTDNKEPATENLMLGAGNSHTQEREFWKGAKQLVNDLFSGTD